MKILLNTSAMRNLLFLLLFIFPLFLKAQFNEWLPKQAMSDSTHNNRNACFYGQYLGNFLFWDQELNATTTQLCYRSINNTSLGDQQVALFQIAEFSEFVVKVSAS